MKIKPDKQGGNSDIYFIENLKARKYLRNTSSKEKIERFKLELEIMGFFKDKHVDGIIDIYDVFVDSNDIKKSYIEMKNMMVILMIYYVTQRVM